MSNKHGVGWTDERIAILKRLWNDRLSASQVAAELGGVTRNGVIGKVHRLGLPGRRAKTPLAPRKPRKARSSGPVIRVQRPADECNGALACAETAPEIVIPFEQRKTLLQLTDKSCRWPVGDPASNDFFFCGSDTYNDHPYCAFHCRVAYQPARDRRRDQAPPRGFNALLNGLKGR